MKVKYRWAMLAMPVVGFTSVGIGAFVRGDWIGFLAGTAMFYLATLVGMVGVWWVSRADDA